MRVSGDGNLDIVKLLIDAGADVNLQDEVGSVNQQHCTTIKIYTDFILISLDTLH